MESKKKNNGLIIIIVLLLAICGGFLGYKYGKSSITPRTKFIKAMNNYLEKNESLINTTKLLKDGYNITTTNDLKVTSGSEEIFSGKFNTNNTYDGTNQYTEITFGDGSDSLKGIMYLKDNKAYIKLNDIFDKFYYMDIDTNTNDYNEAYNEIKESITKVVKEYFTEDKFVLTKEDGTDKINISLTGKDGANLVIKFYEEIKDNDKVFKLFTDEDNSLSEVKANLREEIDNIKDDMESYSDEVVISYNMYLNKNTLVKQELTLEDIVLTITGEESGNITLTSAGATIISGTFSKDNLTLKITADMANAEISINRQNIKEDKISGVYKIDIKLTSGGNTVNITLNTNIKFDKSANIPNIDLSTAKSFEEMTDSEQEEIYSKLYPILEPIMESVEPRETY